MNVIIGDKVILVKEFNKLKTVGTVYVVSNIFNEYVVLSNVDTNVNVAAISMNDFSTYFQKHYTGWTSWTSFTYQDYDLWYRTNGKKVQVKDNDGRKGEATCNKTDVFNLYTGLNIAALRYINNMMKNSYNYMVEVIKNMDSEMNMNRKMIKQFSNHVETKN